MTSNNLEMSAGTYFVRYLSLGLILLLLIIFFGRGLSDDIAATRKILISAAIVLINLSIVILYSAAVLRNTALRADPEAPDLAYYLGFSLTVGALAFSFLGDLFANQPGLAGSAAAASRGHLVENALGQFGAGLLATLFGLCSKIYLSSRQTIEFSDPEQLYQQLRTEITAFRTIVDSSGRELAAGLHSSSQSMLAAGESAARAMTQLASKMDELRQSTALQIASDQIVEAVSIFRATLEGARAPTEGLATSVATLNRSVGDANASMTSLITRTAEFSDGIAENLKVSKSLSEAVTKAVALHTTLLTSQQGIAEQTDRTTLAIQALKVELEKLVKSMPPLGVSISTFTEALEPASAGFKRLAATTAPAIQQLESFDKELLVTHSNLGALQAASESFAASTHSTDNEIKALMNSLSGAAQEMQNVQVLSDRLSRAFSEDDAQAKILQQRMDELSNVIGGVVAVAQDLKERVSSSTTVVGAFAISTESATNAINAAPPSVLDLLGRLDAMAESVRSLGSALERLTQQSDRVAQTLAPPRFGNN